MTVATATVQAGAKPPALEALGEVLLGWGALSSLLYAAADVLAALRYEGYGYASQAIRELGALGAPTRTLVVALTAAYAVLVVGFGAAVCECARGKRALRATGGLLIAYGLVALAAPFFPADQRGAPASLAGAVHVALAAVAALLVLATVAVGAGASGRRFRLFSVATFATVLAFGALAAFQAPRIAAGLESPWVGVAERVCAGAYLLWVAVLDVALMRAETRAFSIEAASTPRVARG